METAAPIIACEIHKTHSPANLTIEYHHVIPVGWQQITWQPAEPPSPGVDPDGRGALWDDRRIPLCPTGHRNVHTWIVRIMHQLQGGEDLAGAYQRAHGGAGLAQAQWGYQALVRFTAVGGKLQDLIAAHQWGQA